MNGYATFGMGETLLETPFGDMLPSKAMAETAFNNFQQELESPFAGTFLSEGTAAPSQVAEEFVQFIAELNDSGFSSTLYDMASEMEDTWRSRISNELAMGKAYVPFARQQAGGYIQPLLHETESMIDKVAQHFSGSGIRDHTDQTIESFFSQLEFNHGSFTPAQEQFLGKVFNKVKSVVKKGVDLAKKGIKAVGKILPVNIILDKLKGLVRPLLDRVLKFAIGKLPKNLQPHAQTLAKKFLNMEATVEGADMTSAGELDTIQEELDGHIAGLVFTGNEGETDGLLMEYESSTELVERSNAAEMGGSTVLPLAVARQQFINELKELQPGDDPAPVIERFLPAAFLVLKPIIKMAISVIGRPKIISFLAGLLAKLVGRYIPESTAKPLASSIIDIGLKAIGFETNEMSRPDLAYEAIANTIEDTVREMEFLSDADLNDGETVTMELLEAFETAAANNFPPQYIKEASRRTIQPGVWVLKPRNGPKHCYKKFTRIFDVTIDPKTAQTVTSFRNLPLANFLRDKLGVDTNKTITAKVHLYEAIDGTKLSAIPKYENLQGFNPSQRYAWVQLHPLTTQAASLLLKEPGLGKDVDGKFLGGRHKTTIGQRFYFLEINGTRLRIPDLDHTTHNHTQNEIPSTARPSQSGDVQVVINFIKSSIHINYYFSEEDAKSLVEKLNKNDALGAALSLRNAARKVLNEMLRKNVGNKVKIVHEMVPELYLDNMEDTESEFSLSGLARKAGGLIAGGGKELVRNIIQKLVNQLSELAYRSLSKFFKERAGEFKMAQADPKDGVTVKIMWQNVGGMSVLNAAIKSIRGNLSPASLTNLTMPNIQAPKIVVTPDKSFE